MPHRLRRMCVSVILGLLAGCGSQDPPPGVALARNHLQHDDAQLALDSLAGLSGSADIHYLKGVALMQLDKLPAAMDEFDAGLEISDQPRIRACRLKLRLFARDLPSAAKLIELELEHPADPVVRLACVYAYEAQAVRLAAEAKHEAAAAHRRRAATALDTALALVAEIPEFHPELLDFAVEYGQAQSALRLVRLMREQEPTDARLERREIRLMMATGDRDEAMGRAHRLHLRDVDDPAAAELYAASLATSTTRRPHDSAFRNLRKRFPGRIALIAHHARYLAANQKLTSACQMLATALESQGMSRKADSDRWPLIQAAINLPLQAGATGLAEQQLNRYRGEIGDELLVTYYEGQLLHLQQDYDGAQQKMTEVLRGRVDRGGRRDPLVTEAVRWLQRIRRAQDRRQPATS
jgi:tetratricopeptide (TPR) repeat protein